VERRKWVEWVLFSALAVGALFFLRWMVPKAVYRVQRALAPAVRLDPGRRNELRASETKIGRGVSPSTEGDSGIDPCLLLPSPDASSSAEQFTPTGMVRDCLLLAPDGRNLEAVEVDLRTGALVVVRTDLVLSGTPAIAYTHVVRPPVQAFWQSGPAPINVYDVYPDGDRFPYRYQDLHLPGQERLESRRISNGTSYLNAVFEHGAAGIFAGALSGWNGAGWDVDLADGTIYVFPDAYAAAGTRQAALEGVIDPSGGRLTVQRNGDGDITSIRTSDGRQVKFYYEDGRLQGLSDSTNQQVRYAYDPSQRLSQTTDASNRVVVYSYAGDRIAALLTTGGSPMMKATYDGDGRVATLWLQSGEQFRFRYKTDFLGSMAQTEVRGGEGNAWQVKLYRGAYTVRPLNITEKGE
jgi:YD repeat-containing protein